MERHMTGIVDVDREILMRFDDRELLAVCFSNNKYSEKLCDEMFFKNRLTAKFPKISIIKPDEMTWRNLFFAIFAFKDRLSFVLTPSSLDIFLNSLQINPQTVSLYNIIEPLFKYKIISIDVALKILIIAKLLNIETPNNFFSDFMLYSELDPDRVLYVNHLPHIETNQDIKRDIDVIYKKLV